MVVEDFSPLPTQQYAVAAMFVVVVADAVVVAAAVATLEAVATSLPSSRNKDPTTS
jgi:hypothetical protein